jgi:ferredoxin-NADP reductase
MRLTLQTKKQETPDVASFIFKVDEPFQWIPGQFLRVIIPSQNPDERGIQRYFSIASAPFENQIMITTRFASEKGSSFKNDLQNLAEGENLEATGPMGSFILDDLSKQYVFIAGGIGITPFRSILLQLDHEQKEFAITLLYANRNQDIVYKSELDALAQKNPSFQVDYIINPERIDPEVIQKYVKDPANKLYYLSGPKPMVEGIEKNLLELNIPKEQIKTDYFPGYEGI